MASGTDESEQPRRYWLGVVHRSHVLRGVELGIAQTSHGAKGGIQRMRPGDGMVYYSPKTDYPEGTPLREFTAIGLVADGEPWQTDEGGFRPWRRRVEWVGGVRPTPIAPLLELLDLTRGTRNWGYQLRRGQLEMTEHDFRVIAAEMGAGSLLG